MGKYDSDIPIRGDQTATIGLKWVREDMNKKADRDYVDAEFASLSKSSDRIKGLVEEVLHKPHTCVQVDAINRIYKSIEKIKRTLDGWRNVKLSVTISIILLVSAGVANYVSLTASVDKNIEAVEDLRENQIQMITEIKGEVNSVKGLMDKNVKKDNVNSDELKEYIKSVLQEVIITNNPRSRRSD